MTEKYYMALLSQVKGVYCFQVKGGPGGKEGKWIVDAKNGSGAVIRDGTGQWI